MLTLTQIELVQNTFAIIAPIADDAASLFYRRLFEIDPSLKDMFKGDMAEQRRKLMQMLTAAVKGLPRLDRLVPVRDTRLARLLQHLQAREARRGGGLLVSAGRGGLGQGARQRGRLLERHAGEVDRP